jgi:hypothetical protein
MPLLNAGLGRRLLLACAATIAFAVFPQLALAQGPGSLAQLTSPNNCIQDTNVAGGSCPNSTANGLSGATDVAVSPDGNNVYVLGLGDEAIAEFTRAGSPSGRK